LKPGLTVDQVKQTLEQQKLGTPKIFRAPSFKQQLAIARNQPISPNTYESVQRISAETSAVNVDIFFAAHPNGEVVSKVVANVFSEPGGRSVFDVFTAKYGAPVRRTDHEWLWGDEAAYEYARTKPYLELQPRPASMTAKRPIAAVIIGDPTYQKSAKEALELERRR
jgi:hypothetical protein